ncbi:MAG TPA: hypothetical protein DCE56_16030 [Cyanobacteria bacterium UBA8553]|nr:hypothetical protein [Cyanobacteria bacterium UBA8553]HAJ61443.1 hypothetical protein [Cyanobacteria bacterium UBA8543]
MLLDLTPGRLRPIPENVERPQTEVWGYTNKIHLRGFMGKNVERPQTEVWGYTNKTHLRGFMGKSVIEEIAIANLLA